jgi:transcriptional regulator with XRE-family HTH domain
VARQELARFLRDRRENLSPAGAGLPAGPRRRTPGLRREEVAGLASMSVEYYARLEQARGPRPSPRILDALAGALRLSPAERMHLFRLAGTSPAPPPGPAREVRPYVASLLRRLPEAGAVVTDASYDVIAWNPLAGALLGHLGEEPNLARRRFLDPGRQRSSGAEEFSCIAVARLRAAADRYPRDERLARLLADLRAGSEEFVRVWDTNPVRAPGHRSKTFEHPEIGPVRINCDVLTVPDDDQQVVFMTADPGSPSARALRHLLRRPGVAAEQVAGRGGLAVQAAAGSAAG